MTEAELIVAARTLLVELHRASQRSPELEDLLTDGPLAEAVETVEDLIKPAGPDYTATGMGSYYGD